MKIEIEKLDWKSFQDLCLDILKAEGFNILRASGIGPDRGMDILANKTIEYAPGCLDAFIWLVQCKHKSDAKSLSPAEVGDFVSDISRHNANGYWLMTNCYLSTSLEDKITSVDQNSQLPFKATYSNGKTIKDFVYKHRSLLKRYSIKEERSQSNDGNLSKINPFKELQSYNESDRDFFFGRDKEIDEVLSRIYKYKIVGLFGESGTGKTSLINAGLVPLLKEENFYVILVRPLDEPVRRIREAIMKNFRDTELPHNNLERLAVTQSFPHLIIELKSIMDVEKKNLIIIIDQLEEIFTRAEPSERAQLAKGIMEAIVQTNTQSSISFLLSLREDYIGDLWNWSHEQNLEEAWINTYRVTRLSTVKAYETITKPLIRLSIDFSEKFIKQLLEELARVGNGMIYPPYLQIVCTHLFDEYKMKKSKKGLQIFDETLKENKTDVENIIADYLSESMLEGLTEEEKIYAQNILDVLTGPEGLRTFLNIEEISRYVGIGPDMTMHVIEHLTKKKIVHAIVEDNKVEGFELMHDFLSKKFFEKLKPDVKKAKTIIEIFRKAFKEWNQYGILASKDRMKILHSNIKQLHLNKEEWFFLIKSSFSIYWYGENRWAGLLDDEQMTSICYQLINDDDDNIVRSAIYFLGKIKGKEISPILIDFLQSASSSIELKDTVLFTYWYYILDPDILNVLKKVIETEKASKLRKNAVYAYAKTIVRLARKIEDHELEFLNQTLNDPSAEVRKQVSDVLAFELMEVTSVRPLIDRFVIERSVIVRKALVATLGSYLIKKIDEKVRKQIVAILEVIVKDDNEDYRVVEEARQRLEFSRSYFTAKKD
jgi:hypothetical protein